MDNLKSNRELESDINKLKQLDDLDRRARKSLSQAINRRGRQIEELENRLLNNTQYEIPNK